MNAGKKIDVAFWTMMAIVAILIGIVAGSMAFGQEEPPPQEPPKVDVTLPPWVAVYRLKLDAIDVARGRIIEFRVVVRAKGEGDAAHQAAVLLQPYLLGGMLEKLEFMEACEKVDRPVEKKK